MTRFYLSTTLLITALLMNSAVCAQAFKKGNTNLDIGLGFAAYQTTVSFTFDFLGEDFTFVEKDDAASFVLPISFEYGLSDKIGVGLELVSANYFVDDQDTTNVTDRVPSFDYSILLNYHLLDSEKHDLIPGLTLGGSNVNWEFEDGNKMN